ncbi:hypothetical protein ACFQHV_09365 [Promicromonospora thailandica]|uniref:Secreted protein n=2 Tax=Promicromonospora thailandica TaxID=765201 RepID=A0A9X2G370_9MICO|nr:hypothetical protein [Promicromonospora thailandica]MCP2266230.1 hypothetical protein [Promicromonospora thailandica]
MSGSVATVAALGLLLGTAAPASAATGFRSCSASQVIKTTSVNKGIASHKLEGGGRQQLALTPDAGSTYKTYNIYWEGWRAATWTITGTVSAAGASCVSS